MLGAIGFTCLLCAGLRLTEYLYVREWRKTLSDEEVAALFKRIEEANAHE